MFVKCKYPLLTKVYLTTHKNAIILKIVWCRVECHNLQRKCNVIACEYMVYKLLLEILIISWNSYRGTTSWPNHRLLVCLKGSYCLVRTQRGSVMVHMQCHALFKIDQSLPSFAWNWRYIRRDIVSATGFISSPLIMIAYKRSS